MTSGRSGIALVFLVSCAAPDVGHDAGPGDAGESADAGDAGDDADAGLACTDGKIPGPLGTCVDPACHDTGGSCRTSANCCQGLPCRGPLDPFPCGICQRVEDECGLERPCEEGFTCTLQPPPVCSCDGSTWTACRPTCPATPCEADETCEQGACRKTLCSTEGYACGPGRECMPDGLGSDLHGCAPLTCAKDADCPNDAKLCVNGRCETSLGECSFFPP